MTRSAILPVSGLSGEKKEPRHDDLVIRPAEPGDAPLAAELILSTLNAFGDRLFGFGDHARAVEVLAQFFRLPGNRFSYQYAAAAAIHGNLAGIMLAFTAGQMRRSMAVTALQMARAFRWSEIPAFLANVIPYRSEEKIFPDELYIAHLAVAGAYRRKGVGQALLEHARQIAPGLVKRKLSLITEVENTAARALYEKFGFKLTETILPPPAMRSPDSEGDVRMVMPIK
jgi:ribosomal protein S18 acetylase RimI-like enzyme